MPYVGEKVEVEELAFEVLEVERRRVTKLRVRRTDTELRTERERGEHERETEHEPRTVKREV
jgi:Mg2+/Co2+ transporter CorC